MKSDFLLFLTVKGLTAIKGVALSLLLLVLLTTAGCSSEPKDLIVGRWEVVDEEDVHVQFEFLKDGRANIYEKGVIQGSLSYTMATDGRSLVLQHPAERENLSLEIVELKSKSAIFLRKERFSADTLRMRRI